LPEKISITRDLPQTTVLLGYEETGLVKKRKID
jgi:hypothetical protein